MKRAGMILISLMAFAMHGKSQDYSGHYVKNADLKPDGVCEMTFPGEFDLVKTGSNTYQASTDGRTLKIEVSTQGSNTFFIVVDSGNGYLAVGSGTVVGNNFIGTFTDARLTGDFKYVRR